MTRWMGVDVSLPLSGSLGAAGHVLVLLANANDLNSTRVGCGPLSAVDDPTVSVAVSANGITGSLTFSQAAPWASTVLNMSFTTLVAVESTSSAGLARHSAVLGYLCFPPLHSARFRLGPSARQTNMRYVGSAFHHLIAMCLFIPVLCV